MPINGAALDWQRVDRWTSDIVAGETAAIKAVFIQYGAQPPDLVWNPSTELASAQQLRAVYLNVEQARCIFYRPANQAPPDLEPCFCDLRLRTVQGTADQDCI